MMKKNYSPKLSSFKNVLLTTTVVGAIAAFMSFGPMFMGPGLTTPEPFQPFVDTAFSPGGTSVDPYQEAFPNLDFDTPLNFNIVPGQSKIVLGQRDGKVFWFQDDESTTQKNLLVDLSTEAGGTDEVGGEIWDGGFLGLAIHPNFGTPGNNLFFIYYTSKSADVTLEGPLAFRCGLERFHGNYLYLEKFEVNPATMAYVAGSKTTMIKRQMYNTTHRGGGMEFGDDGFLYLSTGDQAAYVNARDIAENLDGGVLRIDVDMIGGSTSHAPIRTLASAGAGEIDEFSGIGYFIPNDNPFNEPSAAGTVFEEYYSLGHRNPHRMTKDRATGIFYIGEVGESTHEEINVLSSGKNYGWPLFEATLPQNFTNTFTGQPCVTQLYNNMAHEEPLVEFTRSEANAIIGGYVYRGQEVPGLTGQYICADYGSGSEIWQVNTNDGSKQLLGNFAEGNPVSFGQDYQGELYILSEGDGVKLYKLRPATTNASAPALLSQTGAFTDLQNLIVQDGFVPYEMIASFWSDGALKKRWIGIPNDGTHNTAQEQIQFSENGVWDFPIGSIIIKHFDYPIDDADPSVTRKIETRFSIKGSDGNFYFLTYKWLPDESDAQLVDMEVGETISIDVATTGGGQRQASWLYPSNSQCISCHSPALGGTLGLRTRNLNSDYDYSTHDPSGVEGNQLVTLSALGILNVNITDMDTPGYLTHIAMDDLNGTLDQQARSYLDNNCAYCHQSATGNRADFDLRLLNTLAQTGLTTAGINQPIPGLPVNQQILTPGDAANSQLYHRAQSLDPGIMMPPVSKSIVDQEGVALLEAWINAMEPIAPVPDLDTYRLVNFATKATLQVADASNVLGTNVQQGGYEGLDYQHWALEDATEAGYFRFSTINNNRYLDVAGFGPGLGVNVWQWEDNGSVAQQWEVVDATDNTFHIISRVNGNFLGIEPNGNAIIGVDDGSDSYRWEFLPTGVPLNVGIDLQSNLVITSEDGTTDDFDVMLKSAPLDDVILLVTGTGAVDEFTLSTSELTFTAANWNIPQTVTATGVDDLDADGVQYFNIVITVDDARSDVTYAGFTETLGGYNEDDDGGLRAAPAPGSYRIINVESALSAEVLDAGTFNGANIQQGLYHGDNHQQFELIYRNNGQYSLIAEHSGKVIDVEQGNANPGTNVWQFIDNGSAPQLWSIQDAGNDSYYIISELGGHYLTIDANGNILVDVDNGTDNYRWRFEDVLTLGNTGLSVSEEILLTNEDGDTDTFTVVLSSEPTATVTIGLELIAGIAEASLDATQLIFDAANWNVAQTITVTGANDDDQDGAQDFVVQVAVVAPFNDSNYSSGIGDTVLGINYDNDGGDNGAPLPGIYQIRNVGNQQNIMPDLGTLAWQVNMGTDTYDGSEYQHFELIAEGNGLYSIKFTQQDATNRDLYLDNQGGSAVPGTNIWSYIESVGPGRTAQLFQVVGAGDGSYYIISALPTTNYLTVEPDGNIIADVNGNTDFFKWQFLATGFPPEAIATADINVGNAPLTIQFTGSGSTDDKNAIVEYSWDFGNGDTATDADPNYSFTQGGTYNVTLTVTDGDGYEDVSDQIEIIVNGTPEAVASADIISGIAALEVAFTGDQSMDAEGFVTYAWNFGDSANSTEANPVHIFATEGTYNVVLTVTDEGGISDSDTITIVVAPNMAPAAVASTDVTEGEAPLDVIFTGDQSTDDDVVVSYSWDFGDGTSSAIANPVHTFTVADTYTVVLTVTDEAGLTDTASLTIIANRVNGAPIAIATSDVTEGEAPLEVSFVGDQSTDDVGIVAYAWNFNDGTTSLEANPVHTFSNAGTYDVVLTVTDADDLIDSETVTITVTAPNTAPVAAVQADVTEGDIPLVVSFTGDQSTDDSGVVSYSWDFGDGTSATEANTVHTYTTAGSYNVVLTVTDAEGLQDTATVLITAINPMMGNMPVAVATADITQGEAPLLVVFTGDQSTDDVEIVDYSWDFGDGEITTDVNPTHTFTMDGTYNVVLTVTDAEGFEATATIEISVVPSDEVSFEFILTPNPSTDAVQVVMNDNFDTNDILGVMIHDTSGRLIRQFTREEFIERSMTIPTNIYRNEVYVITVMFNNNEPVSKRLIINN